MDEPQQSAIGADTQESIPDICVIVPFFNEQDAIVVCASRLAEYCRSMLPLRIEVIFVDDGSTDASARRLQNETCLPSGARLIKLSRNFGSHGALRAGIAHATATLTTFIPADGQLSVEVISRLYEQCRKGSSAAWAVRQGKHSGILQRLFSSLYARMMRLCVNRAYPRKGIESVMFDCKIRAELNRAVEVNTSLFLHILSLGFKQDFIAFPTVKRFAGASKWTLAKKIKLFVDSFAAFSYAPVRLMSVAGIILACSGFFLLLYQIIYAVALHVRPQQWSFIAAIFLVGLGINNMSIGMVAEYVWRALDASRRRPAFIVDEVLTLQQRKA